MRGYFQGAFNIHSQRKSGLLIRQIDAQSKHPGSTCETGGRWSEPRSHCQCPSNGGGHQGCNVLAESRAQRGRESHQTDHSKHAVPSCDGVYPGTGCTHTRGIIDPVGCYSDTGSEQKARGRRTERPRRRRSMPICASNWRSCLNLRLLCHADASILVN